MYKKENADRKNSPSKISDQKTNNQAVQEKDAHQIAQFEVIKSVERIIDFTDTASEGTNRMSAAHLKMKQSKSTKKNESTPPSQQNFENTIDSRILKASQATFEPEGIRRSLEVVNV